MDEPLDLEELERPRERWVTFRGAEFLVRYATPLERDRFRRRIVACGLGRETSEGSFRVSAGKEESYYTELCKQYVLGWKNVKPEEYEPAKLGRAMTRSSGLLEVICRAIAEDELFTEPAPSGPTMS